MTTDRPHYYNEIDPYCVKWLNNLIVEGLLPYGYVDNRSIKDVAPQDLNGFAGCHFFAGIGGWPLALRMAGWPVDRPVWTGSPPCQPFSVAGKQEGFNDDRDLWPVWFRLLEKRRPPVVFGEEVATAVKHGWLDRVYSDLEGIGYAIGATVIPACAVDAPHRRDRLWFVADANCQGLEGRSVHTECRDERTPWSDSVAWLVGVDGKARRVEPGIRLLAHGVPGRVGQLRALGNAIVPAVAARFIASYMDMVSNHDD